MTKGPIETLKQMDLGDRIVSIFVTVMMLAPWVICAVLFLALIVRCVLE